MGRASLAVAAIEYPGGAVRKDRAERRKENWCLLVAVRMLRGGYRLPNRRNFRDVLQFDATADHQLRIPATWRRCG